MDERVARVWSWEQGKLLPPRTLHIAPTERCNLACHICVRTASDEFKGQPELPTWRWLRIIEEAAEMGVQRIDISGGGEPFLRPERTMAMMRKIKEVGLEGIATTNGTLLTDAMADEIVGIGWDSLVFSIDGHEAHIHDFLRNKPGVFEETVSTVRMINECKSHVGEKLPNVKINSVITRKNFQHVAKMVALGHELGADEVTFIPITVHDGMGATLKLTEKDAERLQQLIPEAIEHAERYGIRTNLGSFARVKELVTSTNEMGDVLMAIGQPGLRGPPCVEPWYTLVIHPDGHVDPCETNTKSSHLGERTLSEVWCFDHHLDRFRRSMMAQELSGVCEMCCSAVAADNITVDWDASLQ